MNRIKGILYAAVSSSTFGLAPFFSITLLLAGFSAFEMMDIQNRILGFPMAMTTLAAVTAENILSDVTEAELITLLVIRALNVRVLDILDVEGRGFHNDLCHRKAFPSIVHAGQMGVDLVFNTRSQPPLVFAVNPIVKPGSTVTRLAVTSGSAHLPTQRQQIHHFRAKFCF